MEAIRLHKVLERDGEVVITGLPCKKGQSVEVILLIEPTGAHRRPLLTAKQLRHSEVVGLWKDRQDIEDSAAYARQLREEAQRRQGEK